VIWSEHWRSPSGWLTSLEQELRRFNVPVHRGGNFDRWDLEVRTGPFASARLRMGDEEHGLGKQLLRFRVWPIWSRLFVLAAVPLGVWLALEIARGTLAAAAPAVLALLLVVRSLREAGAAIRLLLGRIPVLLAEPEEAAVATTAFTEHWERREAVNNSVNGGLHPDDEFNEALGRMREEALASRARELRGRS